VEVKFGNKHLTMSLLILPGEGNAAWRVMPFGLHSASATFSKVFDRTHDKTTEGKPKRSVLASKGSKPDGESGKMRIF